MRPPERPLVSDRGPLTADRRSRRHRTAPGVREPPQPPPRRRLGLGAPLNDPAAGSPAPADPSRPASGREVRDRRTAGHGDGQQGARRTGSCRPEPASSPADHRSPPRPAAVSVQPAPADLARPPGVAPPAQRRRPRSHASRRSPVGSRRALYRGQRRPAKRRRRCAAAGRATPRTAAHPRPPLACAAGQRRPATSATPSPAPTAARARPGNVRYPRSGARWSFRRPHGGCQSRRLPGGRCHLPPTSGTARFSGGAPGRQASPGDPGTAARRLPPPPSAGRPADPRPRTSWPRYPGSGPGRPARPAGSRSPPSDCPRTCPSRRSFLPAPRSSRCSATARRPAFWMLPPGARPAPPGRAGHDGPGRPPGAPVQRSVQALRTAQASPADGPVPPARRASPPGHPEPAAGYADPGAIAVARGLARRDPDGSVVFDLTPGAVRPSSGPPAIRRTSTRRHRPGRAPSRRPAASHAASGRHRPRPAPTTATAPARRHARHRPARRSTSWPASCSAR